METIVQVLQHVDFPLRHNFMYRSHVFDGLENCLNHFWNCCRSLFLHFLSKSRSQLGIIDSSSTICHHSQKLSHSQRNARTCQKLSTKNFGIQVSTLNNQYLCEFYFLRYFQWCTSTSPTTRGFRQFDHQKIITIDLRTRERWKSRIRILGSPSI